MTSILSQNHEDQLKEDLQRVEAEIAHYNEKY